MRLSARARGFESRRLRLMALSLGMELFSWKNSQLLQNVQGVLQTLQIDLVPE